MKRLLILFIPVLFIFSSPTSAQSEPEFVDMWMVSTTFFPETEDVGWGFQYINFSTVPSQRRAIVQFAVDYENNFLPDTRRTYWNLTYGPNYRLTQYLMPYWSIGPGLKYDMFEEARMDKKWYQSKNELTRSEWKFAAVADIGIFAIIPIVKEHFYITLLAEEEIWYEVNGRGWVQMPKLSLSFLLGF